MALVTLLYNTSQIFDANEQTTNGRNKTHIQTARLASQIAKQAKIRITDLANRPLRGMKPRHTRGHAASNTLTPRRHGNKQNMQLERKSGDHANEANNMLTASKQA